MKAHWLLLLVTLWPTAIAALFGRPSFTSSSRTDLSLRAAGEENAPAPASSRQQLAMDFDTSSSSGQSPTHAIILMDGFCPYHGAYLAARARDIPGVAVIHVLSDYLYGYLKLQGEHDDEQLDRMRMPQSAEEYERLLGDEIQLVAVYCESDSGLADAEQLRDLLQVECCDDPTILLARRDKYKMHQMAKEAGLAVPNQMLCSTAKEAISFSKELLFTKGNQQQEQQRVVVKPIRGVASESVQLCTNLEEVQAAWDCITATQVFGSSDQHSNVLVQEHLAGTEYAVDIVSRGGSHKVAAIWYYVKQPANGASFCYFKTQLVDATVDENVERVCDYATHALNALGVKWGLSHTEVIVDESRGPMLVEVNCRQHNMDFCPLTMACIGYNALDLTLVAFLGDDDDWDPYPDIPVLRAHGCMVHLVNYAAGRLVQTLHLQEMADLASVFEYEVYEKFQTPGEVIEKTVDIRTDAGWAQLINENPDALQRDFEQIVKWMPSMFETIKDD